jgi:hypothetical protein
MTVSRASTSGRADPGDPTGDEILDYCHQLLDGLGCFASVCAGVPLDVAPSFGLCHLNKCAADINRRIPVLTRSSDRVANFESTMNAVFATHHIDSILIWLKSSLFLNQAAILAGGFSFAPELLHPVP